MRLAHVQVPGEAPEQNVSILRLGSVAGVIALHNQSWKLVPEFGNLLKGLRRIQSLLAHLRAGYCLEEAPTS